MSPHLLFRRRTHRTSNLYGLFARPFNPAATNALQSPESWRRKPTEPAVKPTGPGHGGGRRLLEQPKVTWSSAFVILKARYSLVIALHGPLPDISRATVSQMGSVLVAIISRQTRRFPFGTGRDLFTGNVKVMRQRPRTT